MATRKGTKTVVKKPTVADFQAKVDLAQADLLKAERRLEEATQCVTDTKQRLENAYVALEEARKSEAWHMIQNANVSFEQLAELLALAKDAIPNIVGIDIADAVNEMDEQGDAEYEL